MSNITAKQSPSHEFGEFSLESLDPLIQLAVAELLTHGYTFEERNRQYRNLYSILKDGVKHLMYVHQRKIGGSESSASPEINFEGLTAAADSLRLKLLYLFVTWVKRDNEIHICVFDIQNIGHMSTKVQKGHSLKIAALEGRISELKARDGFAMYKKILNVAEISDLHKIIAEMENPHVPQPSDLKAPERADTSVSRIIRDSDLSRRIKTRNDNTCQLCRVPLYINARKREKYAEAHHIQPLGEPHNGPDVPENMICVCPNCHALLDYGGIALNEAAQIEGAHEIGQQFIDYHNGKIYNP